MIERAILLPPHIIDLPQYRQLFKEFSQIRSECSGGYTYPTQDQLNSLKNGNSVVLICTSCRHQINVRLVQPFKLVPSS